VASRTPWRPLAQLVDVEVDAVVAVGVVVLVNCAGVLMTFGGLAE